MASVQEQTRVPATVDQHPQVLRHEKQRAELEAKLKAGQAKLTALHVERDRLQREHHQAEVAHLLGDGPSKPVMADRFGAIEAELEAVAAFITAAHEALELHTTIAGGVRTQVQADIDREVTAAALDVARRLAPLVEQVLTANNTLTALLQRLPGPVGVLPIQCTPYLSAWLAQPGIEGR